MLEDSDMDIRPFASVDDFAEIMTPELTEQEESLRLELEKKSK